MARYGMFSSAILISGVVNAQVLPESPSKHNFWDAANRLLFASHAALEAVDFVITHHNLKRWRSENWIHGQSTLRERNRRPVRLFGARTAGVVAISYLLHRTATTDWSAPFLFTLAAIPRTGWLTASPIDRCCGVNGPHANPTSLRHGGTAGRDVTIYLAPAPAPESRRRAARWRQSSRPPRRLRFR